LGLADAAATEARGAAMTRSVLLIARAYPPLNAAGAHRPAKLAKYLPAFGWTPVVLCAEWTPANAWGGFYDPLLARMPDVCETVRVPHPKRASNLVGRAVARTMAALWPYHVPWRFWRCLKRKAERLVGEGAFDALWSTYSPGVTHRVAGRLSARFGVPWVADFRDLPDQHRLSWRARWAVRREIATCRRASALTTVSDPLAARLAARYEVPVRVIMNGFDPDDCQGAEGVALPQFTIGYFGLVYEGRDPRPLFAAADRLLEQGAVDPNSLRIDFYGTGPSAVDGYAAGFRCRPLVRSLSRLPHREMTEVQRRLAVLLLLSHADSPGIVTSKIFDYLGARRPILDVPGGDVTRQVLADTGAGVSASDPAEIADVLARWYREWKRTGTVAYAGDPQRIARYSCRERARELAQVLDSVAAPG
jgi:glycosyltransferase involved in cell wall biosynthesis